MHEGADEDASGGGERVRLRRKLTVGFWWLVRRGHGTYVQDEKVVASVAGTLERVNKLVSVKPLRTK